MTTVYNMDTLTREASAFTSYSDLLFSIDNDRGPHAWSIQGHPRSSLGGAVAMSTFRLTWAPDGKPLGTVQAVDRNAARRKAPKPYRKFLGEIHVDELLVEKHLRIYTIRWWSDDTCRVTSQVNGALVGTWEHGAWYGALNGGLEVPVDVQELAAACRPNETGTRTDDGCSAVPSRAE